MKAKKKKVCDVVGEVLSLSEVSRLTKQVTNNAFTRHSHFACTFDIHSHQTLYNLANYLGALAMITVVVYHFVAVNARHIAQNTSSH
ncbi:hypothetical protein JVU11DRAFT_12765 [Chiua virens]|nr:hypothetical protein JVU11DRAFT_12765 [Chiua virens]